MFNHILDFLFPFCCVGCESDSHILCKNCCENLKYYPLDTCPNCSNTSSLGKLCLSCEGLDVWRAGIDALWPMFLYEKGRVVAKLLHSYKYDKFLTYGQTLHSLLASAVKSRLPSSFLADIDYVTWVPLTASKLKKRGFNQSESLLKALDIPLKSIKLLDKLTENEAQMSLNKADRDINVRGVYKVRHQHQKSLYGKNIVIVDDVATTVSTLNECARELKKHGALKVYGLVLARQEA